MMSSEILGCETLNYVSPLSPDLQLGTMSTSDMFDLSWDCSSGLDSGLSSGTGHSSPSLNSQADTADDDFILLGGDHGLESNLFPADLEDCFDGNLGLLSFADSTDGVEPDFSFLHDTASNLSNASSSSSTITSYSIPQSPSPPSDVLEDVFDLIPESPTSSSNCLEEFSVGRASPDLTFSSASGSSSSPSCLLPSDFLTEDVQNVVVCPGQSKLQDKKKSRIKPSSGGLESGKRDGRPRKRKKKHRSPLTATSQLPSNLSASSGSSPSLQSSSLCQKYRGSAKENSLSPRKKKIFNILDSNVRWSELSGSEQWVVGEGLNVVLSQSLGVRERLDLLNILGFGRMTDTPVGSGELDLTNLLNNERLELIRRYFRGLDSKESAVNVLPSSRYEKGSQKQKTTQEFNSIRTPKHHLKKDRRSSVTSGKANRKHTSSHKGPSHPVLLHDTGTHTSQCPEQDQPRPDHWFSQSKKFGESLLHHQQTKHAKKDTAHQDVLHQRTRTKKGYRQLLKEKRSGLFKQEVVVSVSSSAVHQLEDKQEVESEDNQEDVDILG